MNSKSLLATLLIAALAIGYAQGPINQLPVAQSQTTLGTAAKEALLEALVGPDGEYAAYATYTAVLQKYGAIEPYASILKAEAQHIAALQRQLDKYKIAYPVNPFLGKVILPTDLKAIAETGVEAEANNVAMYDKLLKAVANYPDLTQVLRNLQRASQQAHLPMFKAAADNGGQLTVAQMQALNIGMR